MKLTNYYYYIQKCVFTFAFMRPKLVDTRLIFVF